VLIALGKELHPAPPRKFAHRDVRVGQRILHFGQCLYRYLAAFEVHDTYFFDVMANIRFFEWHLNQQCRLALVDRFATHGRVLLGNRRPFAGLVERILWQRPNGLVRFILVE
jgi:hypothetical protein